MTGQMYDSAKVMLSRRVPYLTQMKKNQRKKVKNEIPGMHLFLFIPDRQSDMNNNMAEIDVKKPPEGG
ncbi:hypothetical protein EPIR_1270 [Erwinia piriflorinigrans CFBP 5888]|uniref:Uncharacterized protein n=1 Tax=Erwinia piriflorinigrans CFBP 5888 TaxID=1161919 RepID=V5Z6I4_9GAMM|nr:hypothetical protein EPIR_1270 [Erwinia piriflorinigrans CFBP 5888]